jgi:hypothetical protein
MRPISKPPALVERGVHLDRAQLRGVEPDPAERKAISASVAKSPETSMVSVAIRSKTHRPATGPLPSPSLRWMAV